METMIRIQQKLCFVSKPFIILPCRLDSLCTNVRHLFSLPPTIEVAVQGPPHKVIVQRMVVTANTARDDVVNSNLFFKQSDLSVCNG